VPKNKGLPTMVIATMSLAGVHYKIYGPERQQQAPATEYGLDDQHRFDRKLRRLNMEQTTVARMKEILRENEIAPVGDRAEVHDKLVRFIEQENRNGLPMLKGRGRPNVGGPILPVMNTVERTSAYIHEMIEALHAQDKKLILDNAKVHSAPTTTQNSKFHTNMPLQVYFLPPYSPEMNPIELMFNKVKHFIRKKSPRTQQEVEQAIDEAMATVSMEDINNFIRHSGYLLQAGGHDRTAQVQAGQRYVGFGPKPDRPTLNNNEEAALEEEEEPAAPIIITDARR